MYLQHSPATINHSQQQQQQSTIRILTPARPTTIQRQRSVNVAAQGSYAQSHLFSPSSHSSHAAATSSITFTNNGIIVKSPRQMQQQRVQAQATHIRSKSNERSHYFQRDDAKEDDAKSLLPQLMIASPTGPKQARHKRSVTQAQTTRSKSRGLISEQSPPPTPFSLVDSIFGVTASSSSTAEPFNFEAASPPSPFSSSFSDITPPAGFKLLSFHRSVTSHLKQERNGTTVQDVLEAASEDHVGGMSRKMRMKEDRVNRKHEVAVMRTIGDRSALTHHQQSPSFESHSTSFSSFSSVHTNSFSNFESQWNASAHHLSPMSMLSSRGLHTAHHATSAIHTSEIG